jgi:proline racemase
LQIPNLEFAASKLGAKYKVVDSHTAGAATRLVIKGSPRPEGRTMMEKKKHFAKEFDYVRTSLMQEPRGNSGIVAFPVAPSASGADYGLIFADFRGYVDMCIHGTIGVVTSLVECGLACEREIERGGFVFDTPAGIVKTEFATKRDGNKVSWVKLTNVPSVFLGERAIETQSLGSVKASLAFGGNIYAYVNSKKELSLEVKPENIRQLLGAARELLAGSKKFEIKHPTQPGINGVLGVSLYQDLGRLKARNVMVAENDLFDRSPCGTGSCGRMAVKHAKGEIKTGEEFENRSIIDSVFYGRILESRESPSGNSILPEIRATAYITAVTNVVVSKEDPLSSGFLVTG